MSQALYRKWRPQKWEELVGQPHIVQTLKNAIIADHVAHAYLFAGPRGTGKTTAARLLAKSVNCLDADPGARPCNQCINCRGVNESRFLDLIEIDAASENSVEGVRNLRDKINFSPNSGKYKIYIIDEVHMFSNSAFNALLKTLEEPPPHAIFILATTEIHKIPPTVISRCQRHEFRRLPLTVITTQLEGIAKEEKLQVDPEALTQIARQSAGGLRDAISLLDQLSSTGKVIDLELTRAILGTATSQTVLDLVEEILNQEMAAGMDTIHSSLDSGTDARLLCRQVVEYLRAMLLIQMGNHSRVNLPTDIYHEAEKHAARLNPDDLLRLIRIFNDASTEPRGGWQPSLSLELTFAEALEITNKNYQHSSLKAGTSKVNSTLTLADNPPTPKHSNIPAPISPPQKQSPVDFSRILQAWKEISASVRENQSLNALLNSCKVLELKENTLILGFASDILRDKAKPPEQIESIRRAIKEVLGVDLEIKCVVFNTKKVFPSHIKEDGMVAAALKAGGEIVDIQE